MIDDLVAGRGDDIGVAEEDPEIAVVGDRVGLGHEHHAGLEGLLERLGVDVLAEDVRAVGDEVDAVGMDRARLHALLAEKFSRGADRLERSCRA